MKVLTINNQDFFIGFEVGVGSLWNTLGIGCFEHNMNQMGYGISLANNKRNAAFTERLPEREKKWHITEGIFHNGGIGGIGGMRVYCNTQN